MDPFDGADRQIRPVQDSHLCAWGVQGESWEMALDVSNMAVVPVVVDSASVNDVATVRP